MKMTLPLLGFSSVFSVFSASGDELLTPSVTSPSSALNDGAVTGRSPPVEPVNVFLADGRGDFTVVEAEGGGVGNE